MSGWAKFAHRFTQYYRTAPLWSPPRLKSREWMFIPFGPAKPIRHKGFSDINEVRNFVCNSPFHSCFYSTAYWKNPHQLKMADKGWLGADLIFDLDGVIIDSRENMRVSWKNFPIMNWLHRSNLKSITWEKVSIKFLH